jgi:transcriptional regulator with XRE-family HTH domain
MAEDRSPKGEKKEEAFDLEVFKKRLEDALWARRMRQIDLARKTEVNYKSINSYATGRMKPSLDVVIKIAKALEVSVDFLLGRAEEMNQIAPEPPEFVEEVKFIRRACAVASPKERKMLLELAKMIINEAEQEGKAKEGPADIEDKKGL